MEGKTKQEELMARYLLGELTEEERTAVEERFFADHNYFEELLSVEEALLNDYSAGKLSDSEAANIRENLLASRFQLREFELNRNLTEAVRQLPLRPEAEKPETPETPPGPPVAKGPASAQAWQAGARRLPDVSPPRIADRPRPSLANTLAAVAALFAVAALISTIYFWRELKEVREQYSALARQTEEITESLEPPALPLTPSSQHRSEDTSPQTQPPAIKLRAWMKTFILELKINERSHRRYSALIERVGQRITDPAVWSNEFGVENITEQGTLEIPLPARDFQAADYMVTIKGLDPDRAPLTSYYYFEVER